MSLVNLFNFLLITYKFNDLYIRGKKNVNYLFLMEFLNGNYKIKVVLKYACLTIIRWSLKYMVKT